MIFLWMICFGDGKGRFCVLVSVSKQNGKGKISRALISPPRVVGESSLHLSCFAGNKHDEVRDSIRDWVLSYHLSTRISEYHNTS